MLSTVTSARSVSVWLRRGIARLAVGWLDQRLETELQFHINTNLASGLGRGVMQFRLHRPIRGHALRDVKEHRDGVFVSRGSSWFDTMGKLRAAHDQARGTAFRPSPDRAWEPMWAPWGGAEGEWRTRRQEMLRADDLLQMAAVAKELGFGAVTNSGSWFVDRTPDASRDSTGWGYPDSIGDFSPAAAFGDMKQFVRQMRAIGMVWLPWISPWLAGRHTRKRKELQDAMIQVDLDPAHPEHNVATSYLCPRHPFTQQYVCEMVERLIRAYELDGFLMDMVEFTTMHRCIAPHEHNYDSVGLAMDDGLARLTEAVYRANADALIEFRPRYSNLCNLYRATHHRSPDSGEAGSYDMNRRHCVIMRSYMPPGIAVHCDPQWWHIDEADKTVAKMLSTLAVSGVPQIGADLINIPPSHRRLIKVWLSFYREHKQAFRTGRLRPTQQDALFSTILVESGTKGFVSYASFPALKVPLDPAASEIFLFNCTNEDRLYTILQNIDGQFLATIHDIDLTEISHGRLEGRKHALLVDLVVPEGGCVRLQRS